MATVQLTDQNFDDVTRDKDVVVDFWADWCGPCHASAPVFEHISDRYPDVLFGKVDVERNPRLAARFSIRSTPRCWRCAMAPRSLSAPGRCPPQRSTG